MVGMQVHFAQRLVIINILISTNRHYSILYLPHVRRPGVTMHLEIETTGVTHRRPRHISPPETGAGCVTVTTSGVGAYLQLP